MIQIVIADLNLPAHAAAFILLLEEYARDPTGGGKRLSEYAKDNLVAELKSRSSAHIILAFAGDVPVGLLTCIEGFSTFACKPLLNIHDAVVSSDYRGRGLSKQMLQAAESLAISLGCCKLTLEVLEGNTIAHEAYKSFGFKGYELDPRMGKALFLEKSLLLQSELK
ncbi:MAG: GNAT family N-acetyltransferase [Cellvibrionaceae bacterium]|nr:GNAT family N-acetyltransferase [Cellvibrionaceae bacterium]